MRIKIGFGGLLVAAVLLSACCLERELPDDAVYLSDQVVEDLARACRISTSNSELNAIEVAILSYQHDLLPKPAHHKPTCARNLTEWCGISVPCDQPVDLAGAREKYCPPRPPEPVELPRYHYAPCMPGGCGGPRQIPERNLAHFDRETLADLDKLVVISGAHSRSEALHKAILHYEQIWRRHHEKRDLPYPENYLPTVRKPGTPCEWILKRPVRRLNLGKSDATE